MNLKTVRFYLGNILWVEAVVMLPSLIFIFLDKEAKTLSSYLITIGVLTLLGWLLRLNAQDNKGIHAREGFVIVSVSWILLSAFGGMPFMLSGYIPSFVDAFFETASGFTTTGATILTNVEALPRSLLYWRSFTHWLGGMGVLVFLLAIMPQGSNHSGDSLHVLRAESPGPQVGKLVPKMRKSAFILYAIYVIMTIIEIVLLMLGGMPFFDALTNSFATAGTGGFAIKNASIAHYDSFYLQGVIGVFMVLFGVNFNVYYFIVLKQFKNAVTNEEVRAYLGVILISTVLIAINIMPMFGSIYEAFHHSFFQVSSIITTTGFATANFDLWPEFSRIILVLLMIIGACAGSTGGGIKVVRFVMLYKSLKNYMQKLLHPRAVKVIKMDGKVVDDEVIKGTFNFAIVYFFIAAASIILTSIDNLSMETTTTAVLACLNNVGPGLDLVGPNGNFSMFTDFTKIVLSFDMLIGRLEIFPMLMLCMPSVWKRNK